MKCNWCESQITGIQSQQLARQYITHGLCSFCTEMIFKPNSTTLREFLDSIDAPILLMQQQPRKVVTANKKACEVFGKSLAEIEDRKGGEVLDCVHAYSSAGCGEDRHCENCKIKDAVVETFETGKSFNKVATFLEIKKDHDINLYNLQVSTEKAGDMTLLRIDQYEKA